MLQSFMAYMGHKIRILKHKKSLNWYIATNHNHSQSTYNPTTNQIKIQNSYLKFLSKSFCSIGFVGIELIVAMEYANFDYNFDDIFD